MQRSQEAARAEAGRSDTVERTITELLAGARLSGATTNPPVTFFQGLTDGGATEVGSDRITFTTTAPAVPGRSLDSADDFETQQTANGPVGGLAEVSLGMVAVGNPGDKTGLFERVQRPSDGDPTQGGLESVLGPDIASIGFQFWDGQQWQDTWDTTTMTPARLPQAVQVTYRLKSESSGVVHLFVAPIPASNVSALSPVTSTGTTAGDCGGGDVTTGAGLTDITGAACCAPPSGSPLLGRGGRANRSQRGGYIFVEALVVVVCLVALMAMLAADQRANLQGVQNRLRERRAAAAADAAINRALAVLGSANANLVQPSDEWALQGTGGADQFDFSDGSASYRIQIVDCGSLLNVNTATSTQLGLLPLTQDQVDSLLDWRETGTQARPDGAKDTYYNALTQPYNTKLGPLDTVNELLLVKGWTGQTLYQTPTITTTLTLPTDQNGATLPLAALLTVDSGAPNTQASGSARINLGARGVNVTALTRLGLSRNLAMQLAARAPFTSFQTLSAVPGVNTSAMERLLNAVTFTTAKRTQGKINLNTATQAVLQTVPSITTDVASSIVAQQSSGFSTLGALATVPGITARQLGQIADSFTVGGDTWLVRAYGESGGVGVAVEAVVGLRNGQVQVINWNRLSTGTIPTWWGWVADPTQTLDAGAAQ